MDTLLGFNRCMRASLRTSLRLALLPLVFVTHLFACECRISARVSKYLKRADVVFLGKVVFTNDDGSGTFLQKTLVHFQVEEPFKGLSTGEGDVWADPGSFTSCYAAYDKDGRYLVFAYRGERMPTETAAVTISPEDGKRKPLPPGIDPANPPSVYIAPECTGTLPITKQTEKLVNAWLKDLRAYRKANRKHGY